MLKKIKKSMSPNELKLLKIQKGMSLDEIRMGLEKLLNSQGIKIIKEDKDEKNND